MISAAQSAPDQVDGGTHIPSFRPTPNPASTPEMALLLAACARTAPGTGAIGHLVRQPIDWSVLLSLAQHHGVTPLLCRTAACCTGLFPREILSVLHCRFQETARANLMRLGELARVLDTLTAGKISVIPFKGPNLGCYVYGDVALREFSDLDVLIRPNDLPAAKKLLLEAGYSPEFRLSAAQEARYLRSACELNFTHRTLGILLELHWQVLSRQFSLEFDLDQLWARARDVQIGPCQALCLSPEDLLLILSAHAAKHLWARLLWTADIAELLSVTPGIDWDYAFSEARRIGAARILSITLLMADALFRVGPPSQIHRRLEHDRLAFRIASSLSQKIFSAPLEETSRVTSHLTLLLARERWRDRSRYASRTLLASARTRAFGSMHSPLSS